MSEFNKNVETVKVMVRCRPLSTKEKQENRKTIVEVDEKASQVIVKKPNENDTKSFSFDCTFGAESTQQAVYQQTGFQIVQNVLEGYNGTIFAYGQTGCGKTFIMMGVQDNEQLKGIIPRTFSQIVTMVDTDDTKKYLVRCSFLEIYNQQIHDLLSEQKSNLQLKQSPEKGLFVKDLSLNAVKTSKQMERWMTVGFKNRAVRATQMNNQSSRSHSIFTIYIESEEVSANGGSVIKAGKLNLVDLAGSQRQSKTQAVGEGLKEAAKINLSLSALGNVISALVDGKTNHIPYRDSKLTRLLQDSLGGNTKTIMIAALSPADYNYEQTISTLRYASRAKFIKNKPRINQDPKDAALREYAEEIGRLKMLLEGKVPLSNNKQQLTTNYINQQGSDDLKSALIEQQKKIKMEKEQRQKLQRQLQNLQEIMSKPKPKQQSKQEKKKLLKIKQQLKERKRKKQQYKKQREHHQEVLVNKQKNFQNLNQEIDSMRKQFKQLKVKYKEVQQEIKDVKVQQEVQKEDLLETIRQQDKQLNKLTAIMQMLLTSRQIEDVQKLCFKDEQTRQYDVPFFFLREKMMGLPKLRQSQQVNERKQTLTSESCRNIQSSRPNYRSHSTSKNVHLNPIPMHLKGDVKDPNSVFAINSTDRLSQKRRPSKLDPLIPPPMKGKYKY